MEPHKRGGQGPIWAAYKKKKKKKKLEDDMIQTFSFNENI
jgi:hypothetical protein